MTSLARTDRSAVTEWRRTIDWPILIASFALLGVGLLLSLSAGPPAAEKLGYASYHYVYRHVFFVVIAAMVLVVTSVLKVEWVRRFSALIYVGCLVLMLIVLMSGHEAKGAQRWIRFAGFTLQPSEMIKPALIVLAGWLLAQRELFPKGPWTIISFCLYAVVVLLLLLQPDVGQSVLLTAGFLVAFYVAGLPWRWGAGFAGGGAALGSILYLTMPHVRDRVHIFLVPSSSDTYQIDKAAEAISNGGLFGVGPGEGAVKFQLPDAHTDFIYSVLSEEFGLIAALALLAMYTLIVARGCMLASRIEDLYPRAAATGLFALFGLQAAINIAVNVSLIPPKGMTLPLISSGGSSLIGTALTLGLALALVRRHGAHIRWRKAYG